MSGLLELRQGTPSSSRDLLVPPLELQQGAWGPFKLWLGLGVPLNLQWVLSAILSGYSCSQVEHGTQSSFRVLVGSLHGWESSLDLSLGSPH